MNEVEVMTEVEAQLKAQLDQITFLFNKVHEKDKTIQFLKEQIRKERDNARSREDKLRRRLNNLSREVRFAQDDI